MMIPQFFLALLLALSSGCSIYRKTGYTLQFTHIESGRPPQFQTELAIEFPHVMLPLNAPNSIVTNLDERGLVVMTLPDHSPTWMFLRGPGAGGGYVFDLDLRSMRKDSQRTFSFLDKHTAECHLLVTKTNRAK